MTCRRVNRENFHKQLCCLLIITAAFIVIITSYLLRTDNQVLATLVHIQSAVLLQTSGEDLQEDDLTNTPYTVWMSEIIRSQLELPPRTPPQEQDVRDLFPNVFSSIPAHFLTNTRNPCWYEEFNPQLGRSVYEGNAYAQTMRGVHKKLGILSLDHREYLRYMDGKQHRLRCLPYIYILGQPKSGTTDLFYRLTQHPQIVGTLTKEPHWWTRQNFGLEHYVDLCDDAARQIQAQITSNPSGNQIFAVDGSTSTMWDNKVCDRIFNSSKDSEPEVMIMDVLHAVYPGTRLIAILRDPGERLYSQYLFSTKGSKSTAEFHSMAVQTVQMFYNCLAERSFRWCVYNSDFRLSMPVNLNVGMYAVYLNDWLALFPKDQILVLRSEDYSTDLKAEFNKLYRFLDIAPLTKDQEEEILSKPVYNPRHQEDVPLGRMLPETSKLLREFYEPFNVKLASLLDNDGFLWRYE